MKIDSLQSPYSVYSPQSREKEQNSQIELFNTEDSVEISEVARFAGEQNTDNIVILPPSYP